MKFVNTRKEESFEIPFYKDDASNFILGEDCDGFEFDYWAGAHGDALPFTEEKYSVTAHFEIGVKSDGVVYGNATFAGREGYVYKGYTVFFTPEEQVKVLSLLYDNLRGEMQAFAEDYYETQKELESEVVDG